MSFVGLPRGPITESLPQIATFLALVALVMHLCRNGHLLPLFGGVGTGGLLAWLKRMADWIRDTANNLGQTLMNMFLSAIQWAKNIFTGAGLGGLLNPVMDLLASMGEGVRDWLKETGALGWAALAVLAGFLMLYLMRR